MWETSIGNWFAYGVLLIVFFSYGNKTKVCVCLPLLFAFDKHLCACECAIGSMPTCVSSASRNPTSILQNHH